MHVYEPVFRRRVVDYDRSVLIRFRYCYLKIRDDARKIGVVTVTRQIVVGCVVVCQGGLIFVETIGSRPVQNTMLAIDSTMQR